jgi:hypothetical protein
LLKDSLPVQANMIQSRNGQSQSEPGQSKPRGRFTGQRLKLLRPETYRQAVELLAEPRQQVPYDHVCGLLHVGEHTLKAIEASESLSIAVPTSPKPLSRSEATEKIMLVLGEAGSGVPVQLNLQVNAQLLHARYAELVKRIEEESDPPAAMDLQRGGELPNSGQESPST